jgi:FlaA1/EpsC-like NDP-sugar epimerase
MTRFLLRLEEAIDLVFKATVEGETGQLFVKKMPACYVINLAKVMGKVITGKDDYPIKEVGIRPGEKIHEVLVSEEEMRRAVETEEHYVVYPYGELEKPSLLRDLNEYNSNNTQMFWELRECWGIKFI